MALAEPPGPGRGSMLSSTRRHPSRTRSPETKTRERVSCSRCSAGSRASSVSARAPMDRPGRRERPRRRSAAGRRHRTSSSRDLVGRRRRGAARVAFSASGARWMRTTPAPSGGSTRDTALDRRSAVSAASSRSAAPASATSTIGGPTAPRPSTISSSAERSPARPALDAHGSERHRPTVYRARRWRQRCGMTELRARTPGPTDPSATGRSDANARGERPDGTLRVVPHPPGGHEDRDGEQTEDLEVIGREEPSQARHGEVSEREG